MEGLLTEHVKNLEKICRICGKNIKNVKSTSKYKKVMFKEDLCKLYGIYVDNDLDEVHPRFICKNDARKLYCVRSHSEETSDTTCSKQVAKLFLPHDQNCELCFPHRSGRPWLLKSKSVKKKTATVTLVPPQATGHNQSALNPSVSLQPDQESDTFLKYSTDKKFHGETSSGEGSSVFFY
ncbi:uncharacterized protein LOC128555907 [Mercenaria mercenaria]|uniref:uncharacterized protein LOC128555907 n=1 Tax=Mercenaria mercenaria TaxID=6596 RepID=UPI00234F0EBD|nr:uncharacterized protein LOC128555907 [Mercenaria mercenaria]